MEPQIRFCRSSDGVRLAFATYGEPSGPPLVLVRPDVANLELDWKVPQSRAFYDSLAEGRCLISFDRRGVGASQREVDDLRFEAQIGDLAAIVDHLKVKEFDLSGIECGAPVAIAYAARNPDRVRRLVLWAPFASGEDSVSPEAARGLAELCRSNWSLARRALADLFFPSGPIDEQRRSSDYLRVSLSAEAMAKSVELLHASVDVRSLLPQVKAPTLVLHRQRDRVVPFSAGRAVASLIPDARFVALEGEVNSPYFDHAQFMHIVNEFLNEGRSQEPAAEPSAPSGLVTILFTDVEGSTALTQRLGDAKARDLLREHERMVREALKSHGGSELKTTGDGFMASFSSATRALECAISMQRAFAERNESAAEPILVRIGLNAGEPITEEKDLFGTAVNEAARITASAKGGEILVSDVVRQLAKGKDFVFADRGEVSLKGFEEPVRLYEVRWREEDA